MSFGFSIGDFVLLTQLANTTIQNARKACGAHDAITQEVKSLHAVLRGLEAEVSKPESILNKPRDNRTKELSRLARGCKKVLKVLSKVLDKYNALSDEKRSVTKLWQKVKFGNDEMLDMREIRSQLTTYTQAITMFLNLTSIGSQGKVEQYMESHGEELRDIKESLNWVTASMQANSHEEGSILTSYAEDDKVVWKSFRRELIKEGFSSRTLGKHKRTIIKYVLELGARGALDEIVEGDDREEGQPADIDEMTGSSDESSVEIDLQEDEGAGSKHDLNETTSSDSKLISEPSHPAKIAIDASGTVVKPNICPTKIGKSSSDQKTNPGNEDTREISKLGIGYVEDLSNLHLISSSASPTENTKDPIEKQHRIEDAIDEDFLPEAHPNCFIDIEQCNQEDSDLSTNTLCDKQENLAGVEVLSNNECPSLTHSPINNNHSSYATTILNSGHDSAEPATPGPFSGSLFPVSRSDFTSSSDSEWSSSSASGSMCGATVASDDTRIIKNRIGCRRHLNRGLPVQPLYTEFPNYHENPPEEDILRQHNNIYKNSELSMRLVFIDGESEEYGDPHLDEWTKEWVKKYRTEHWRGDGRGESDSMKYGGFRIFISDGQEIQILYRQDEYPNYTEDEKRKQWRAFRKVHKTCMDQDHLDAEEARMQRTRHKNINDDGFAGEYMRAARSDVNREPLDSRDKYARSYYFVDNVNTGGYRGPTR